MTVKNIDDIVSKLVAKKMLVLLVNRGYDANELGRHSDMVKDIVAKYAIDSIGIEQPPSSLLPDRQHPTADAHTEIAEKMLPAVTALIAKLK